MPFRYSAIFAHSPNPYVVLDPQLRIVEANDAYLAVTMRERADIVGKGMFEAFPSDPESESHKQLLQSFDHVREAREPHHIPLIHYAIPLPQERGFEDRYWSATHTPIINADGELAFILQHTMDVTELHRLRQAMRPLSSDANTFMESAVLGRAEAVQQANDTLSREGDALRNLFEQAPGFAALLSGPSHVFTLANPAYMQLIGGRDILGKSVAEALPEVVAQGFVTLLDKAYASGEAFVGHDVGVELVRADGLREQRVLDFVYQPILDSAGRVSGIFVQGQDVSERRMAERALRESEARFRLVAENAPVMLWMGDTVGRCLYLNQAQRAFWGVAEDGAESFQWSACVHSDDWPALSETSGAAMAEHRPFEVEARHRRADGVWRTIRTQAHPRFDMEGHFVGMIGVNSDVTDIRAAEHQLRQINEWLESRVEEVVAERRRAELALQQSQKMETIGKLTGGVAHDFNNLLQVISGNLQLLMKDVGDNDRAQKRISNALAGVSRGSKLASHLLAFGRRQALEPKVINIGRFLNGIDELVRRALGEAIEIETVVSGGLWNALVDPNQMENALLNLAINARDAMEGVGRLTIEAGNAVLDDDYARAHGDIQAGQYVMLAVTDTGSGMSAEILEQAFEPFFSTKPEGKGTGLGLSMVYGFVKQSGGHVKIYSEVGQGTSVKLYLPRVLEREDSVVMPDLLPVSGGTETILVAEDDEGVRATVVEMLSDLGYRVLKARDAASALTVIESGAAIDLLFTDVVMPGPLKSPDLARKARERLPHLAVLFTSGYTENSIVHGGRLDLGVELLSKPYTREALARKLRHVLGNQEQRNVAAARREPLAPEEAAPASAVLRVLLVEDDALIRMNVADMLADAGHTVSEAGSAEEGLTLLQAQAFDVIVTDLGLPGLPGCEFARRARLLRPEVGIIFASGQPGLPDNVAEPAVFLRKPFDHNDLQKALGQALAGNPDA